VPRRVCDDEDMAVERNLPDPLLGEWACLGILYDRPSHGWAIARRLRPEGDVGRIWSLSRPLTYRSLDQLTRRGWIAPVGEEPGVGGPNRTILAVTRAGRAHFRRWVRTPVDHLRDLRSELLLKLVFADLDRIDAGDMVRAQRTIVDQLAAALEAADERDVVALWRIEATRAAQRFIDQVAPPDPSAHR
jgi:DNA-binding PadR family transcriptional regulator